MEYFDPKGNGEFWRAPDRYLNALPEGENKLVRRRVLQVIKSEIDLFKKQLKLEVIKENSDEDGSGELAEPGIALPEDWKSKLAQIVLLIHPIAKTTCDPMERCREVSYEILTSIVTILAGDKKFPEYIPWIFSILFDRFGNPEILECSEEVRLVATNFMLHLINTIATHNLLPYTDDFNQMLSYLIVDPYHSVRIAACRTASVLASKARQVFAATSDKLIPPLCKILNHQQYRVRSAGLECLGDVVLFGNHKTVGDVIPHVTQCLFDSSPQVRAMLIGVAGNWLLNFVDRYSYFQKFLPIILTGLSDESPDNATLADKLWGKVGAQYLEENLNEYKDEVDFENKSGGVLPESRPTIGCRILVWRHVGNMLPGVVNDITDWSISTRIKCSQILHQLLLHSEEKMTMHVQCILRACSLAIGDEHQTVVRYKSFPVQVSKACWLLGFFVPLDSSLPNIFTSIQSTSGLSIFKVLGKVLEGAKKDDLDSHVAVIGEIIAEADQCETLNATKQHVLLNIGHILADRCSQGILTHAQEGTHIFRMAFTIYAMAKSTEVCENARSLLEKLKSSEGCDTIDHLVALYGKKILEEIQQSSLEWTSLSPNKLLFEKMLCHGSMLIPAKTDMIMDIMIANLGPERDAQVRLRFFTMLADIFQHCQSSAQNEKKLDDFVKLVVKDVLTPNLSWVAGKSAAALRTAASSCVLEVLKSNILTMDALSSLIPPLTTAIISLLDDSSLLTRLISCQCIETLASTSINSFQPDLVHRVYPSLLKRLDDASNDVRLVACIALSAVTEAFGLSEYDPDFYRVHIEGIVGILIIHLDDDDEEIRHTIHRILNKLAKIRKDVVAIACESFRIKHRSTEHCDTILREIARMEQTKDS